MSNFADIEAVSSEAAKFYEEVRGLVVVFLIVVFLFSLAHLTLRHLFRNPFHEVKLSRSDRAVHQIVFGICTFTLTISLIAYFLTPFLIVANQLLLAFKKSYYLQWLDPHLVRDLILIVRWGAKLVCILLPFSYFLFTSVGVFGLGNSFTARFCEAALDVVFSYILTCGTFWSCSTCITFFRHLFRQKCHPFSFVDPVSLLLDRSVTISQLHFLSEVSRETIQWCLHSVHFLLSSFGLVLLFLCTPLGLVRLVIFLLASMVKKVSETRSNELLLDDLVSVHFNGLQLKDCIQSASCASSATRWYDDLSLLSSENWTDINVEAWKRGVVLSSEARFSELQRQFTLLKDKTSPNLSTLLMNFLRPILPYMILCVLFCLFHITQSFVLFNILSLVKHLIVSLVFSATDSLQSHPAASAVVFPLGDEPASALGHLGALLQICAVHFLLFVSLWGFYSIPTVSHLLPRSHSLTLEGILLNVLLMFMFSSALPLQSNLLGLTALSIPNIFDSGCHPRMPTYHTKLCTELHRSFVPDNTLNPSRSFQRQFVFTPLSGECAFLNANYCSAIGNKGDTQAHTHYIASMANASCFSKESFKENFTVSDQSATARQINVVILMYNLIFLSTSIWIAGRRLGDATLVVGLEVVTSLRCLRFERESLSI